MTTVRCPFIAQFAGLPGLVVILGGVRAGASGQRPVRRQIHGNGSDGTARASEAAAPLTRVEVTSAGFQPSRIDVGSGRGVVFRRTSDKTCATSAVFPALGIEKALPPKTDVAVALPPGASGELAFQCRMAMDRGNAIVG